MTTFIQITDHHLRESEGALTRGYSTWHALRAVLRHIARHHANVDFIVSTGDLVNSGGDGDLTGVDVDTQYQTVRRALSITGGAEPPGPLALTAEGLRDMPLYVLPGNLDPREAFFRNLFPASPLRAMNVSFMHGGVRFVCVDWGEGDAAASTPAMFEFLARALAGGLPSVILMHHHVVPSGLPLWDSWIAPDVAAFWAIVAGRNVLGIFSGHTHATFESRARGIPVFGLRSTSYAYTQLGDDVLPVLRPPHYRVVTVSANALTTAIVEVPL
ncbi:MAG: metallophosphoesterase [Chloroflexi bacterium]|nr:metallophosphoesterase [Chloroflexota bacterium]